MRKHTLLLPVCTLALAAGYGVRQDDPDAQLEARIQVLEQRLGDVEAYLLNQAVLSEDLGFAIDEALVQGFTWGENGKSRETLVAAWFAQIDAALSDIPGVPVVVEASADPRIRRRAEIRRQLDERKAKNSGQAPPGGGDQ